MSGTNAYMNGGDQGLPTVVTPSGNVGTYLNYDNIVNVGRILLRTDQPYQFPDCPASGLKITMATDNIGTVWLGGLNDQAPQVNAALPLVAGASLEIPCTNSNMFSVIGDTDGDQMYLIVYGVNTSNLAIEPGNPTPLDRVPPTITSTTPANGLTAIPINSPVSVLASKALDPSTINSTNVLLTPDVAPLAITTIPDSTNPANILITYTGAYLPSLQQMTITVSGLKSLSGYEMVGTFTSQFTTSSTTEPPNPNPPTIVSYSPLDGAVNVVTSVAPTISFSLPILASSVTTTNITVTDVAGPSFLTGYTFTLSSDGKTVTINGLTLTGGKQYRIDVYNTSGTGIESVFGVFLDNTYSFSFTTKVPYTIFYNVSGNSPVTLGYFSGAALIGGEIMSSGSKLIGKIPLYFVFTLRKNAIAALSGTVTFKWQRINSSGQTVDFVTIGSMAANAVATSYTSYTFNLASNTTAFQLGDYVGIEWESGNASNYLQTVYSTTKAFSDPNSYYVETLYGSTTGGTKFTGGDFAMIIGVAN